MGPGSRSLAACLVCLAGIGAAAGVQAKDAAPPPFEPQAWTPPPPRPATGVLAPNRALREAVPLFAGQARNPEDLTFDAQGRMYFPSSSNPDATTASDGRIHRVDDPAAASPRLTTFAVTDGNPLDMRFDWKGNLLVADWVRGLLSIDPQGKVTTLIPIGEAIGPDVFRHPDGVAMAPDGRIFVSIGSAREVYDPVPEILEQKPYGRLVELDPRTGAKQIVIPDLYFANGVVVDPAGRFVLVSDQYRYRIARYWLTGPLAGTRDNLVEGLPGFVHNLSWAPDGTLWATLFQGRVGLIDAVHPYPWLKGLLARLPASMLNPPLPRDEAAVGKGSVLKIGPAGEILRSLQDPSPRLNTLSSAVEHGGALYIGTITGDAILRYPLAN